VKILRVLLATIFYLLAAIACLSIAFMPVAASWLAVSYWGYAGERAQWCIVVRRPVPKGLVLTDQNVDWTIRRIGTGDRFIPDVKSAVGRYALVDLAEGEILKPEHLSQFAPSGAAEGSAAIPVEVKAEHAVGLKPGMRLAFVQEKEKKSVMLPEAKVLNGEATGQGFELLSVAASSKDPSVVTLTVAILKHDLVFAQDLAVGQWRPVILSTSLVGRS
jgi:hypothetical protein